MERGRLTLSVTLVAVFILNNCAPPRIKFNEKLLPVTPKVALIVEDKVGRMQVDIEYIHWGLTFACCLLSVPLSILLDREVAVEPTIWHKRRAPVLERIVYKWNLPVHLSREFTNSIQQSQKFVVSPKEEADAIIYLKILHYGLRRSYYRGCLFTYGYFEPMKVKLKVKAKMVRTSDNHVVWLRTISFTKVGSRQSCKEYAEEQGKYLIDDLQYAVSEVVSKLIGDLGAVKPKP